MAKGCFMSDNEAMQEEFEPDKILFGTKLIDECPVLSPLNEKSKKFLGDFFGNYDESLLDGFKDE